MIDFAETIPEEVRLKVQFSVVKVCIQRLNRLQNALYGKTKPDFKVDLEEWENLRGSTAGKKLLDELERQKKILWSIMKSALIQLP